MRKNRTYRLLSFAVIIMGLIALTSCASSKASLTKTQVQGTFRLTRAPQQEFFDLAYGVTTEVIPTPQQESGKWCTSMSNDKTFTGPIQNYVHQMGLIEKKPGKDYTLKITQNRMEINSWNGIATVVLDVRLEDASGKVVYTQQATSSKKAIIMPTAMNEPCTKALEQINWNRIASFLRVETTPSREPTKQVEGMGNTALEQMIVRWDVQSRPQGADIFWRVVSKTPEVKSTNNKYLMTTPYEATKTLDIKGLSYQTSGDVRIILRCEKDGYHPQEKEFNVRMVLDQEEISAFFRLVKEE